MFYFPRVNDIDLTEEGRVRLLIVCHIIYFLFQTGLSRARFYRDLPFEPCRSSDGAGTARSGPNIGLGLQSSRI